MRSRRGGDSSPVARNLAFDFVGAAGVGVTLAFVAALLPTIARRGGIDPLGIAAITATPFIANLMSAFAGRWGPRTSVQLALIRGAGAATLLGLLLVPAAPVIVAIVFIFWISLSMSSPFQLRLWGALYPGGLVGRIIGFLGMGRAAAGALAAFAGGVIADRLGVSAAVMLTAVFGVAAAMAYAGQRERITQPPPTFSARDSIRVLRERPLLNRIALAQGFYGGGLIAAVPLFAFVHVDRLGLSLAEVGVIGILLSGATMLSYPVVGVLSDRFGPLVPLRAGGAFGLVAVLGYAFAPSVGLLWLAAATMGVANAAAEVGILAIIGAHTPLSQRAAALAGWNTITGARAIVAMFAMSAALGLGLVTVTSGLLISAGVAAVGVVLYFRVAAIERRSERQAPVAADALARSAPAA